MTSVVRIGTDLEEVRRFEKYREQSFKAFLKKILRQENLNTAFRKMHQPLILLHGSQVKKQ